MKVFSYKSIGPFLHFYIGQIVSTAPSLYMHGRVMNPSTATGGMLLDKRARSDGERDGLYVVSVSKFLLLYALTAGGYMFYWSYRNWASYKEVTGAPITPLIRAVFWPFFILCLFEKVQNGLDLKGRSYFWHPETRGLLIMFLVMLSVLLSLFFNRPSDTVFVLFANLVLIACGAGMFVEAQRAINVLSDDPNGRCNSALSGTNVVWMAVGVLYMALVVYAVCIVES